MSVSDFNDIHSSLNIFQSISQNITRISQDMLSAQLTVIKHHWDDYLGDCKSPSQLIHQRLWSSKLWYAVKFMDVYFRSIGEVGY